MRYPPTHRSGWQIERAASPRIPGIDQLADDTLAGSTATICRLPVQGIVDFRLCGGFILRQHGRAGFRDARQQITRSYRFSFAPNAQSASQFEALRAAQRTRGFRQGLSPFHLTVQIPFLKIIRLMQAVKSALYTLKGDVDTYNREKDDAVEATEAVQQKEQIQRVLDKLREEWTLLNRTFAEKQA